MGGLHLTVLLLAEAESVLACKRMIQAQLAFKADLDQGEWNALLATNALEKQIQELWKC